MAIFNSYVSLPEGMSKYVHQQPKSRAREP